MVPRKPREIRFTVLYPERSEKEQGLVLQYDVDQYGTPMVQRLIKELGQVCIVVGEGFLTASDSMQLSFKQKCLPYWLVYGKG